MREENRRWVRVGLVALAILFFAGMRGAMVSGGIAIRAAEAAGYTDVQVVDRHNFLPGWYGCSGEDAVGFEVEAKNPQGKPVQILVCSGLLMKGATVRLR